MRQRPEFVGLPRYVPGGELIVDWTPAAELDLSDSRVVRQRHDGRVRLTSVSHLRVFRRSEEAGSGWAPGPAILPETMTEEYGIEDPRITQIDGRYWITYVAVSRHGAATALASTEDFESLRASRGHLSAREQRCCPAPKENQGTVRRAPPANRQDRLLPSRGLAGPVARPAALGWPRALAQWRRRLGKRADRRWCSADRMRRRMVDALPRVWKSSANRRRWRVLRWGRVA